MKHILVLCFLYPLLTGCHLPLAHGFSDQVMPEEPSARAISVPFVAPIYLALAAVDITIINPVVACINLPDEISRAWNEDSEDPNQAKIITGKVLVAPLYTVYLLGFIIFSEQFEKEAEEDNSIYLAEPPS